MRRTFVPSAMHTPSLPSSSPAHISLASEYMLMLQYAMLDRLYRLENHEKLIVHQRMVDGGWWDDILIHREGTQGQAFRSCIQ